MYLLKQGGYNLSPQKEILFSKNNVISKFYENNMKNFQNFLTIGKGWLDLQNLYWTGPVPVQ
jgi:hypothetical protein